MEKRIQIGHGARATERHLLEQLAALQVETRAHPELLAQPIRIVVPSGSLRMHLCERIVGELGSMAGVQLHTLQGLALSIVQHAGLRPHRANLLLEVLCRRAALEQDALRESLEVFDHGFIGLTGVVRDLFDAGFEEHSGAALQELIEDAPLSARSLRRARSLLRVAMDVQRELSQRGTGGRAALLRQAAEVLEAGEHPLPTRKLFIHGFADVTGCASDLLQRLVQRHDAYVLLDHPLDPLDPEQLDRGVAFTERMLQPLEGILGSAERLEAAPESPKLTAFAAPGRQAELGEVARRIRQLLDQGARPERIGIVARHPKPYAAALRRQLKQQGVPFSAPSLGAPIDAQARRILALVELFTQELQCPVERWFDAQASAEGPLESTAGEPHPAASKLLLSLRVTGSGRLGDLLRIKSEEFLDQEHSLSLPLPDRAQPASAGDEQADHFKVPHQRLAGEHLERHIERAKELALHFEATPGVARAEQHLAHFEALRRGLHWQAEDGAERRIQAALEGLAQGLGEEPLDREEFAGLLVGKLTEAAPAPLGRLRAGAGVQVLDVMEARSRSFEQLFVIGLNRDVFPRAISNDPLFPDEIRSKLEAILPDIPIQSRGRLEDRYLFAQLLSASEEVTLSWLTSAEDGKPRMLSPLVERLFDRETLAALPRAPARFPTQPSADHLAAPRDAHEQAVLSALHGASGELASHLRLAYEEQHAAAPEDLAKLRARLLGAFEDTKDRGQSMGPWLGFLGSQEELGVRPDPRSEAPFITRIEGMARCPWQSVLQRFLHLESGPDPLGELPGIHKLALGNIVHGVLRRIDERVLGTAELSLEAALAREPQQVDWPLREEFEAILLEEAQLQAKLRAAPIPGYALMLAECARPFLQAAEELMLTELKRSMGSEAGVLGAEVRGSAKIERADGRTLEVRFQADRVERQGERVLLSDYKTGAYKKLNKLKSDGVPQGRHLQPMAYIQAALEHVQAASGRYLFLGARSEKEELVEVGFDEDCKQESADFGAALEVSVDAWVAGSFFPRLTKPGTEEVNPDCEHCEVKEACLQEDSGARAALREWELPRAGQPASQAMARLMELGGKKTPQKKAKSGGKS